MVLSRSFWALRPPKKLCHQRTQNKHSQINSRGKIWVVSNKLVGAEGDPKDRAMRDSSGGAAASQRWGGGRPGGKVQCAEGREVPQDRQPLHAGSRELAASEAGLQGGWEGESTFRIEARRWWASPHQQWPCPSSCWCGAVPCANVRVLHRGPSPGVRDAGPSTAPCGGPALCHPGALCPSRAEIVFR